MVSFEALKFVFLYILVYVYIIIFIEIIDDETLFILLLLLLLCCRKNIIILYADNVEIFNRIRKSRNASQRIKKKSVVYLLFKFFTSPHLTTTERFLMRFVSFLPSRHAFYSDTKKTNKNTNDIFVTINMYKRKPSPIIDNRLAKTEHKNWSSKRSIGLYCVYGR